MSRQSRRAALAAWLTPDVLPVRKRALAQMTQRSPVSPDMRFVPLPPPQGRPPYRRQLTDVIGVRAGRAIARAGVVRFHAVGDTGGQGDPRPQRRVVAAMERELRGPEPVSFFYHLGDVVYPHGEDANYRPQFFSAYADYDAPIFAVPGNHDGESQPSSLQSFVKAFCAETPPLHDAAARLARPLPAQPNVYWTLVHELVWIVGLYSNVPEGGQFDPAQLEWLVGELRSAPREVTLILAVHQPIYAADATHGSNLDLADLLDECCAEAGRAPDAVFTGHAHNYQRFARRRDGRRIPYVVAGAGGYPERHRLGAGLPALPASFPGVDGVTLEAYEDRASGFMTVSVRRGGADAVYTAVTDHEVRVVDSFAIGARVT